MSGVLQPGYKPTGVGAIPKDWQLVTLGEIFSFKNGLNKGKEYFGSGTPIVNYMDVYQYSGIHTNDLQGRVTVSKEEIKNYEVRKGDVFFTRTSETVEEIGIAAAILNTPRDTVFSGFVEGVRKIV
jgi:type I restriction enzyme S subunit